MTTAAPALDTQVLRKAFGHYPSGVAALAATVDGTDQVLIASTFTVGVSLDPALVLFAVQRSSTTWPVLRRAEQIGISVLSAGQAVLCRQLAAKDASTRWDGVRPDRLADGGLVLPGSAITFETRIHSEVPAGDHEVILLEVTSMSPYHDVEPLVFHGSRFRTIT